MATTEVTPEVGELSYLSAEGDTIVKWNRANLAEVEAARTMFNTLRGKSYAAFKMRSDDTKGSQIDVFDPGAERILMVPPMQGG